jgi:chromosome partitioning protein
MAKIIALLNVRGGSGKTTTAVSLAACLSMAKKKTLLVDLDEQGNASINIGLSKEIFSSKNIYHALIGQISIKEATYESGIPLFHICPSDEKLRGSEFELLNLFSCEEKLKNCLKEIEKDYDYIIIDCPPKLGKETANALTAAHSYIIPTQTGYLEMEGFVQILNYVKDICSKLNINIFLDGILFTMFDSRSIRDQQVVSDIKSHFGDVVFNTIIPLNNELAECPGFGKPIILYDVESNGSVAYLALAREIILKNS